MNDWMKGKMALFSLNRAAAAVLHVLHLLLWIGGDRKLPALSRFGRWPPAYWQLDVGQAKVHTLFSLSLSPWLSHAYTYSLALSPPPPSPSRVARQAAASPRLGINNSSGDRLLPSRCRNILFPRWLAAYRGREEEEEEDGRVHRGGDAQIIKRKSPPSASAVWHSIMGWESAS